MKKSAKIIQISGFRGLMFFIFTVVCLIAGFAVFPGLCAKHIWNNIAGIYSIPQINLAQGVLLWAFTALSVYLASGRKVFLSFQKENELKDDEIKDIMQKIKSESKAKMINSLILTPEDIQKLKEIKEKSETDEQIISNETREEVTTSSKKENS